jgi:hypothetical protein
MLSGIDLRQNTGVMMQLCYPRPHTQYFLLAPHNLDLADRRI